MNDLQRLTPLDADLQNLEALNRAYRRIHEQIGRAIVGQDEVIDLVLACILARGHCILEGVPGLAKTLLVRTLSRGRNFISGRRT